ncbi:hypothetical protein D3C81_1830860 [compost metagenome]
MFPWEVAFLLEILIIPRLAKYQPEYGCLNAALPVFLEIRSMVICFLLIILRVSLEPSLPM